MKAAVLSGIENLEITEVDRPACNSGEVLLKLEACAICKTDTKMFHSGHRDLKLPRILRTRACRNDNRSRKRHPQIQ